MRHSLELDQERRASHHQNSTVSWKNGQPPPTPCPPLAQPQDRPDLDRELWPVMIKTSKCLLCEFFFQSRFVCLHSDLHGELPVLIRRILAVDYVINMRWTTGWLYSFTKFAVSCLWQTLVTHWNFIRKCGASCTKLFLVMLILLHLLNRVSTVAWSLHFSF